jgi:hypothetical protein
MLAYLPKELTFFFVVSYLNYLPFILPTAYLKQPIYIHLFAHLLCDTNID